MSREELPKALATWFPLKKDAKTLQRGAKMKPTTEAEEKEIADALERGVIELEKALP